MTQHPHDSAKASLVAAGVDPTDTPAKPSVLEHERDRRAGHQEAGTTDPALASGAELAERMKGARDAA
jgi:hypothetical protein